MSIGPVEVVVVGFAEQGMGGPVVDEVQALVEQGTVSLVDGLVMAKDADGAVTYHELDQDELDGNLGRLQSLLGENAADLISADDVEEFAQGLEPGGSAAVVVLEHTWARGLTAAVQRSGGRLVADIRVPAAVVAEVLQGLTSEDEG